MSLEAEVRDLKQAIIELSDVISSGSLSLKLELPSKEEASHLVKPSEETETTKPAAKKRAAKKKAAKSEPKKSITELRDDLIAQLNQVAKDGFRKEAVALLDGRKVPDLTETEIEELKVELKDLNNG